MRVSWILIKFYDDNRNRYARIIFFAFLVFNIQKLFEIAVICDSFLLRMQLTWIISFFFQEINILDDSELEL